MRGGIPLISEQMGVVLDLVYAMERPPQRILDLGCGDGVTGEALLRLFPGVYGDFIDYSPAMLEQARKRLRGYPGVRILEADLQRSSLPEICGDVRYDCMVSSYALHHLTDLRKHTIYREIYEILRPGGLFVNVEHVASATPRISDLAERNFVRHLYDYRRAQGEAITLEQAAEDHRQRADEGDNILAPVWEQCSWLREAGFQDVDCPFKYFELAVFAGFKGS